MPRREEHTMKYLLMIYMNPASSRRCPRTSATRSSPVMTSSTKPLRESGELIGFAAL